MKARTLDRVSVGRALSVAAFLTLSTALACGSGNSTLDQSPAGGTGGASIGAGTSAGAQAGRGGKGGTGGSASGTAGRGGAQGGSSAGGAAGQPEDVPNPGGEPPGTPCGGGGDDPEGSAMPEICASGRCETMPGIVGPVCLGACFAEGAPCERSLDCCSTGCFDGRCADRLCIVEGDECNEDAECCSGTCGPDGECEVDEPNRECRPTGEDCSSGTGSGCCNECVEEGDRFFDLFNGEERCGFATGTCFAQGVACTEDADCCRGTCDGGVCRTTCTDDGDPCEADADCCGGSCDSASGTCGTTTGCVSVSGACETAADCCSGFCFGGFCDTLVIR